MGETAAFAQESFCCRIKAFRQFALSAAAFYIINLVIRLMAPLIKGHGGAYENTGSVGPDTVEK